jgi:hypothetical protein
MLAGDAPFTGGGSVQAIIAKVLTEKPTPCKRWVQGYRSPPSVEQAEVSTALAAARRPIRDGGRV